MVSNTVISGEPSDFNQTKRTSKLENSLNSAIEVQPRMDHSAIVEFRHRSQQRGAKEIWRFGAPRYTSNTRSRLRQNLERSEDPQRNNSRAMSRISGTNVSYTSNISAIKLNIQRFKYSGNDENRHRSALKSPKVGSIPATPLSTKIDMMRGNKTTRFKGMSR